MVQAYRNPDNACGREQMQTIIDTVGKSVPAALTELHRPGQTLKRRVADVLAPPG